MKIEVSTVTARMGEKRALPVSPTRDQHGVHGYNDSGMMIGRGGRSWRPRLSC